MRLASGSVRMRREILARQRAQLDADRQPPLQLGQQVGGLRHVEGAGRDEQHVVGLHRPVLGGDGRALDQRQEIALHALARDVRADAGAVRARADLVDLVEEHDAVVLDGADRLAGELLGVDELVALLGDQHVVAVGDGDAAGLGTLAERLPQHVADVDGADRGARRAGDVEHRQARASSRRLGSRFPCR